MLTFRIMILIFEPGMCTKCIKNTHGLNLLNACIYPITKEKKLLSLNSAQGLP